MSEPNQWDSKTTVAGRALEALKYGVDLSKTEPEQRICNVCGEYWTDTGDDRCPFCESDDTEGGYDPDERGAS